MSTPSSPGREFFSANVSPELNGSSVASGSDWHSAQEHVEGPEAASTPTFTLQINDIPQLVMPSPPSPLSSPPPPTTTAIRSELSPTALEFYPLANGTITMDPPPPQPDRPDQTIPGDLSSAFPPPPTPDPISIVYPPPQARPWNPYQTIPGDLSSATWPNAWSSERPTLNLRIPAFRGASTQPPVASTQPSGASTQPPGVSIQPPRIPTHNPATGRPYYDNQTPGIPTHFVPLYGAAHGMFYDPLTRLFHGDGPPRPTLSRLSADPRPMDNVVPPLRPLGYRQTDHLHLQPHSVTAPAISRAQQQAGEPGAAQMRTYYYCACVNRWLAERHDCPAEAISEVGGNWRDGVPPVGTVPPGVVRPGDVIPPEEMTHDVLVQDMSYLTPEQRERVRRERGI
ncbi:MAG: hypothetical protein Q9202_005630 [Teloschistes flavicans]